MRIRCFLASQSRMGGAGKEDETYAIYVQIMKSVADILQGGGSGTNPSKENKMHSEKKHRKLPVYFK